ncbi:MAG: cupin domain-containing protein [Oscillospiraceae bacterium]|nr:cupin domain-containing protein [Oscillospiraceae bacterium]
MSYKVVRRAEATRYEVPNHFDVRTTRLCNPDDVNDGAIVLGLSHFLPGGGANVSPAKMETVYYMISGEMTIELYDDNDKIEKFVLTAGDAVHFGKGTKRSCVNTGHEAAKMLVVQSHPLS